MGDRLQTFTTLESQYNALRREVEQARARNLTLEQILVERGVSEQPESGSEYQGVLEVNQPLVFSKPITDDAAEHIDDAVVGVVAEATSGDELLPVISPDELYPDEGSPPSPATQPDQIPTESLSPAAEVAAEETTETIAIVRSEPPAETTESAAPKPDSSELEGIAEAWLVTDEPRLSAKSSDQPKSDAADHGDQALPRSFTRGAQKRPEPLGSPRRRTKVGIFLVLAIVGVLLCAGIAGIAYFYPSWFERDDWIGNVGSWISALKSNIVESPPGSSTDAVRTETKATDGNSASANNAEVPSGKPVADTPAATPPTGSESTVASAEPVKASPAEGSTNAATAAPEPNAGAPEVADSPSMPKKPSAEQIEAREEGFSLVDTKAWAQAEREIGQALRTFPDDPVLHYLYGRVLANKRELPKAVDEFERAVELDSTMADAYWELGRIYTALKKKDDAKAALESFIHLVPNDAQRTAQAKALIKKLR
jgi:TolA-binding protein